MIQTALITGATSGIGEALARRLSAEGVSLILTGRNKDVLDQLKKELPNVLDTYAHDLAEGAGPIVDGIKKHVPDLIINNAGLGYYGAAVHLEKDLQIKEIDVNCRALTEITIEGAKALILSGKKGVVMNISSAAAFQPFPYFAVYAATKAYVTSLSESLHEEMKPFGIDVLVSNPGRVETNFSTRASQNETRAHFEDSMTVDFAADTILKQIRARKPVHIFDWKYRWQVRLAQFFLPNRLIAKILANRFLKLYTWKGKDNTI